jgi:hypothetical protein
MKTPRDGVGKDGFRRYYARQADCAACALKERCCPNQPRRKIARHVHEAARDAARRIVTTDAYADASRRRKKVEMLFAHLKRILRLDRLRLRGPNGARDEFLLAATAQNLRKLAKLIPTSGSASRIVSTSALRDLPCGSMDSDRATPPPSARSITKLSACSFGNSCRVTGPWATGANASATRSAVKSRRSRAQALAS